MTKKVLITLILLLSACLLKAQMANHGYNDLTDIKEKGIRIVLDDSASAYNNALNSALRKYWNVCPYETLTYTEAVQQKDLNPDNYFLVKIPGGTLGYDVLSVQKVKYYNDAAAPNYLARYKISIAHSSTYAMPNIVQELNREIELALAHPELNGKGFDAWNKLYSDESNKHIAELKNKTLYINKTDLSKQFTEAGLKEFYPYKYKIVTDKEIQEAVNNQDEKICYLFTWPNSAYTSIVDAKDGYLLYVDNGGTGSFSNNSIKTILKLVDKK